MLRKGSQPRSRCCWYQGINSLAGVDPVGWHEVSD
jgi:hypothetical protein